jgi:non-ribosomal peptide synthetase component F
MAIIGTLKAGGAYVPLDLVYQRDRLQVIADDAELTVLLTEPTYEKNLDTSTAQTILVGKDSPLARERKKERPNQGTTSAQLAYIIYTSGSTGKPKGVQITHHSLVNLLKAMAKTPGLGPGDAMRC